MKKRWYLLIAVAVLVVAGAAVGLMMYFKPHKDFGASAPDVVVTVREMLAAFDADEAAANRKFVSDDKTILVRGTVQAVDIDAKGIAVVTLSDTDATGTVSCTFTLDESKSAVSIAQGRKIGVKGQCTGVQTLLDKQAIMIRCALDK
jgi:hypothetical protein